MFAGHYVVRSGIPTRWALLPWPHPRSLPITREGQQLLFALAALRQAAGLFSVDLIRQSHAQGDDGKAERFGAG
jgi:hypothetical protein